MREIESGVRGAVEEQGFGPVEIRTVYSPRVATDWMSESAREKLETYGIAPPV